MKKIKRRNFIKTGSIFGGVLILPSALRAKVMGANDRFNVALIGVGGIGKQSIGCFANSPEVAIIAGCDVDEERAAPRYKMLPDNLPRFRDYRVLLDKMDKDIDGVTVSTPDHMHYPITAWALAKGKHVFCQKPLSRTIWEASEMRRLAKKSGLFTQMGNQGHSNDGWRIIREWYDAGLLGQIEDIYSWTDRPAAFWPQGANITKPEGEPVPATLDYNLWLGAAQYQAYNHAFVPHHWRGLCAYGTGAMGDMGCHFMDVYYSAFELGFPKKIKTSCSEFNHYSWPYESTIDMEFESRFGADGKIKMHWYDGYRKPKEIKGIDKEFIENPKNKNCTVIVGTKETVITNEYGSTKQTRLYSREKMFDLKNSNGFPSPTITRSIAEGNAHLEWALHCLKGTNPPANFEYAAPFTEMVLLGVIATYFPEIELEYDPKTQTFKNCPEANQYIGSLHNYRKEFLPSRGTGPCT